MPNLTRNHNLFIANRCTIFFSTLSLERVSAQRLGLSEHISVFFCFGFDFVCWAIALYATEMPSVNKYLLLLPLPPRPKESKRDAGVFWWPTQYQQHSALYLLDSIDVCVRLFVLLFGRAEKNGVTQKIR